MKIGIVQHSFSDDVDSNRARNLTAIESLAADGAELIVLSELHDSLYFCQVEDVDNFRLAEEIPSDFTEFYSEAAKGNNVVIVTSMFERRAPGLYHNTAVVFDSDGSMAGKYRKMHIPDDPGFYEKFYFTPAISASNRLRRVSDVWACWYAGTNGIRRPQDSWPCEVPKCLSIRLR